MKNRVVNNLFTPIDHAIVRAAVRELPGLMAAIVDMRFWQQMTVPEIADALGVSMRAVESAITKATRIIRETCLRHPAFSRSKFHALQMIESKCVA